MTKTSNTKKETDITVYGATSFVARHVLKYLVEVADKDLSTTDQKLRITLGGRNRTKLEAVKDAFASTCVQDVTVADGSDREGLEKMAQRSRVVLNCAGPLAKHSSLVVEACANVGCDYVDITGEVAWAEEMREKHGASARKSGARIVSFCGYDSVPSDMAVFAAVQAMKTGVSSQTQISNARIWHQAFGMPNGGTIATFCDIPIDIVNDVFAVPFKQLRPMPYFMGDPLSLTNPDVKRDPSVYMVKKSMSKSEWLNQLPYVEPEFLYGVSLPFAMSAVNL
jgi:short subunit dehydrogenase-like uncharacterized protein